MRAKCGDGGKTGLEEFTLRLGCNLFHSRGLCLVESSLLAQRNLAVAPIFGFVASTEPEIMVGTWLGECCRQVEAEEVSNSRNKIHQTWETVS